MISSYKEEECPYCVFPDNVASVTMHDHAARGTYGRHQPTAFHLTVNRAISSKMGTPSLANKNIPEWRKSSSRIKEWCKCGYCNTREITNENVCCMEYLDCKEKLKEANLNRSYNCITKHPAFKSLCLNEWVLQRAWKLHKQQFDDHVFSESSDQSQRYNVISRHQFITWYWGYLRKNVQLPSCVHIAIEKNFNNDLIKSQPFPKLN